jgi:predicted transposase/invertase (TIGR01784 family)
MRRDTIFYQLFQQMPRLLFDLISQPPENANGYIFDAVEVKETGFRLDGVFLPPDRSGIVYFCEVQFQLDDLLYERIDSEIGIYVYRNRERLFDWRAVVIYPSRNIEQSRTETVSELLASGRITRVYLDELGEIPSLPTGLGLMVLTTLEGNNAIDEARGLIERSHSGDAAEASASRAIIDLVSTIMVYKFNTLSRDEVNVMLGIELQQTRVYQEAKAEGKAEEGRSLVLKQLTRKLGSIPPQRQLQVNSLSIDLVESLGEALLDFSTLADLETWLSQN